MKKVISIKGWKRREHFEFFSQFDEPFWGITADVDCTLAYQKAKKEGHSFFISYLHKSIKAVNEIEEFRCRIENGEIVCYDKIHVTTTVSRKNDTFAYSYMDFNESFETFNQTALAEIERVQNEPGLRLNENNMRTDVIHYSSIPWLKFTGLSHARHFKFKDSVPKITFGKCHGTAGKMMMPISVHVNHALVDGIHMAKFFEVFQQMLNKQ